MGELLEAIDDDLDAATTSDLSTVACVQLVWLTTRQKPTVSVSSLRVSWYTELNTICRNKYIKMLHQPNNSLAAVMEQIKAEPALDDAFVAAVVRTQGWDDQWMARPKAKGANPLLPAGQRIIVDYQAPAKAGPVIMAPQMMAPPAAKANEAANAVRLPKASPLVPAKASPPIVPLVVAPPPAAPAASGSSGVALAHGLPSGQNAATPVAKPGGAPPLMVPSEFQDNEQDDASLSDDELEPHGGQPDGGHSNKTPENSEIAVEAPADTHLEHSSTHEVDAGAAGGAVREDVHKCTICHDKIEKDGAEEVMALECSHVYHLNCLEKTCSIGEWPRGWCPQRCLDHHLGLNGSRVAEQPMMMPVDEQQLSEQPIGDNAFAL